MADMAWCRVDDLVILAHTQNPPSDAEWEGYVASFDVEQLRHGVFLVFTEGGAPTAKQRRIIQNLTLERPFPTAVMSASAMVRGVITALGWFNTGIRAFRPDDVAGALAYLGIAPERLAEIERLRDELYEGMRPGR